MNGLLTDLTVQIVSAYLRRNAVPSTAIPDVITSVYEAVRDTGNSSEQPAKNAEPAVSIRSSVKPDYLVCLDCGRKSKILKRHIATAHGLTPEHTVRNGGCRVHIQWLRHATPISVARWRKRSD